MNPSVVYNDTDQIQSVGMQSSFKVQMTCNSPMNLLDKSISARASKMDERPFSMVQGSQQKRRTIVSSIT